MLDSAVTGEIIMVSKVSILMFSVFFCSSVAICQDGRTYNIGSVLPGSAYCTPVSSIGAPDKAFALNPGIARRVEALTGESSAVQACKAIGEVGKCLITAHASKLVNVKFDCLRSDVVGIAPEAASSCPAGTGNKKMTLENAIAQMRPAANADAIIKQATRQTQQEVCLP